MNLEVYTLIQVFCGVLIGHIITIIISKEK